MLFIIILKHFFRYGRNNIVISGEQVHLSLSYCPKKETIEKKFKGLPVRHIRVFVDNDEEFKLLCIGMQKFNEINFTLDDDDRLEFPTTKAILESSNQQ